MAKGEGHRWFSLIYTWQTEHEPAVIRKLRADTLTGLSGRVLEIGCGNGANFELYPESVTQLVATDPDSYMLERARKRVAELGRQIEVHRASAEELPFPDRSFDAVVDIWVLCTVREPVQALTEIRRVLKPDGEFRFLEHVRYTGGLMALVQDLIVPLWRWIGAGCNPNRNTERYIRDAGFQISELRHIKPLPPVPPMVIIRPGILGTAIAPRD